MQKTNAIQYMIDMTDEAEARAAAHWLRTQDGLLGVRVLPANSITPTWRVQALFQDETTGTDWLPDGCRRVMVTPNILRVFDR